MSAIFFQHKKMLYLYVLSELISYELLYLHFKYKENMVENENNLGKINNDGNYWKVDK